MVKFVNLAEIMGQVDTARARDQGMKLNQLLMERQQRQFQREDADYNKQLQLKDVYQNAYNPETGEFDQNALLKGLANVDATKAYETSKQLKQEKRADETYDLDKQAKELTLKSQKAAVARDVIASLTPETWTQGIQKLQQDGVQAAMSAPAQYDPNWIEKSVMDANAFIQQAQTKKQQEFTASENQKGRDFTASQGALNRNFQAGQNSLSRQATLQAAQVKANASGAKLSKGQEQVDKEFAKEYADYKAKGGAADTYKQIAQLKQVSDQLGKDDSLTGAVVGMVPDSVRAFTNPKAVNAREQVEEVVQRNLRVILGAQFTEKEGNRLIARAYNPRLSTAQNKARVDALLNQMTLAAQAKEDAMNYFEENGTLTGWQGKTPTLSDFEAAIDSANVPKSKTIQDADAILGL